MTHRLVEWPSPESTALAAFRHERLVAAGESGTLYTDPVGAGLLAKASCQSTSALTGTLYSSERRPEQARSHKGIVLIVGVVSNLGGDTSQFVSGHRSSGHFVVNFGLFKILYNNVQKDSVHGSSHS